MNERINELWRQVDTIQYDRIYGDIYRPYIPLQIDGQPTRFEITDIHLEKFAELIIRECATVVNKKIGPKSALDVLEHFGVKE